MLLLVLERQDRDGAEVTNAEMRGHKGGCIAGDILYVLKYDVRKVCGGNKTLEGGTSPNPTGMIKCVLAVYLQELQMQNGECVY